MGKNNVKVKGVELDLDKKRTLLFDLNALIELEDDYGSIDGAFTAINTSKGRMKNLRRLLFIGLKHEDEELTEQQVGKFLDMNNIMDISEKLIDTFGISLPDPNEEEAKN